MDPEIFSDFVIEAKEHLETIEPTLLELEKEPTNTVLLNDIFRPMHSLKGASGFLGLTRINQLAHKAEEILEELRKGKLLVTAEIMDLILLATDALRSMIENLEASGNEGEVETARIIAHIEALLAGEEAPRAAEPAPPAEEPASEPAATAAEPEAAAVPEPAEPEPGPALEPYTPPSYALMVIGEGHLADFMEEAREIIENLNAGLLGLESQPNRLDELVNDIFRYFHNLKGNSGIIGYNELNQLTHEAETLLNRVRKGELVPDQGMMDLLLATVDCIDELVNGIDVESGQVSPADTRQVVELLARAAAGGKAEAPAPRRVTMAEVAPEPEPEPAPEPASAEPAANGDEGPSQADQMDQEDVAVFEQTVTQQLEHMTVALEHLESDPADTSYVDALYRSLTTLQNSAGYMGFDELKTYCKRTAGLVDQVRSTGMSFEMILDMMSQECSIIARMVAGVLKDLGRPAPGAASSQPAQAEPAAEAKPAASETPAAAEPEPGPAPKPAPAPKAESKPEAKPEAKAVAKPAPKPAPKAEAKPAAAPAQPAAPAAQPAPAAQNGQAAQSNKSKSSSTIRVDHEKLDHLMNLIGELIINRNRFSMLARSLEEGSLDVQEVAHNLVETTDSMARISDDLQDTIMNVRMVPVGTVFVRFPRLVRDLSRKSGKQVELILEGEETELDKSVVEVIGDPLVHMIRNSVDHGLEGPDVREEIGKPTTGKVWLRAYHKGNSVAIEVEDDGRGIDPAKMRKVGVKKGLVTEEQAAALDDREAMELIFAPGFSSAEEITDISGRGVGMDVVRSNIKNLKGSIQISSEVGKGTKITMILPLTLAIIDALLVTVGDDKFAIPLDAVSETTKIHAKRLTDVNRRKALELRGEVLGIVQLSELLGLERTKDTREVLPIVVIQDNERRLGLVVDRLLERQEIVIKPLGEFLTGFDLRGVSGATIMGDGSVILILDPHEVYGMAALQGRTS